MLGLRISPCLLLALALPAYAAPCDGSIDIGSVLGDAAHVGTTTGQGDDSSPTCQVFSTAPEVPLLWTAPATGVYDIDLLGSSFDTILYVLDQCVAPEELTCNDDATDETSAVTIGLQAGEQVVLMIDGFFNSNGAYVLNIHPNTSVCPDGSDLGSALGVDVASGTTSGGGNDHIPSCSGSGQAADLSFTWTAPAAGIYTLDTFGSSFDTVLELLDDCATRTPLQCSDDGDQDSTSSITRSFDTGESVVLVVDGYDLDEGDYVLNISQDQLLEDCSNQTDDDGDDDVDCDDSDCNGAPGCGPEVCPETDLGSALGPAAAVGTTHGDDHDFSPPCAGGGPAGDASFNWIAPADGVYTFDTHGSSFDTTLYALESCDTPTPLACDDDSGNAETSEITIEAEQGVAYLIVVDGFGTDEGNFELNIRQDLNCEGLSPASCTAAGQLTELVNGVAGTEVIHVDAAYRFRPQTILERIEEIRVAAAICDLPTFHGSMGGVYSTADRTWQGDSIDLGVTSGAANGSLFLGERAFDGAFTVDGAQGPIGDVFARYNGQGQLAGNRDEQIMAGRWMRTAGRRGVFVSIHAFCEADPITALDPWFVGDLD